MTPSKKSKKFRIPKNDARQNVRGILGNWQVIVNIFIFSSRKIDRFIRILHKIFPLSYCLMVWWCLQMKKGKNWWDIFSNLTYSARIVNTSNIASRQKSLNCNLLCISKLKVDLVYDKVLNDPHLKVK